MAAKGLRTVMIHWSFLVVGASSGLMMIVVGYLALRAVNPGDGFAGIDCGSVLLPSTTGMDFPCGPARDQPQTLVLVAFAATIVLQLLFVAALAVKPQALAFEVTGTNVAVRRFRKSDARHVEQTIDQVVIDEMGWTPQDLESMSQVLRSGRFTLELVVIERATKQIVGVIAPALDPTSGNGVHVGMWVGPGHRGRGLMSEALELVVSKIVGEGSSVRAEAASTNVVAQRVLERAGLRQEGTRTVRLPDGREVAGSIYSRYPKAARDDMAIGASA